MMKNNCFHHVCYWIDANVEWLIELELERLKSENKDLLFIAFRQKQIPQAKSLACLVRGLLMS